MRVGIALHEALVNAMHHGNLEVGSELRDAGGDVYRELIERRLKESGYRDRRVHLTVNLSRSELACVIRDEGPGFNPTVVANPTAPENLEKLSGRGLYLIWTFMDRVEHNETGNQITMVKQLVAETVG
jgi:anti-sigma regulatory factor (Ser/Thr protein kinase)